MSLSASLTAEQRRNLPASDFAVPGKRALPIHDEKHVRMAQSMLSKTQGLTSEERATARRRILSRARKFGIDVAEWQKLAAVELGIEGFDVDDEPALETPIGEPLKATGVKFEAASSLRFEAATLDLAPDDSHPNRMPLTGVLTRVGVQSDGAPNGSGGRKVIVTKEAAEKALGSLLTMGLNLTEDLGGHNPRNKVGVITAAEIDGDALCIKGHLYKGDFPDVARTIKARRQDLGFSFEADNIWVENASADPLVIQSLAFTGASILLKNKAAYRSTSLAASAAKDIETMTPEELTAIVQAAMKPLSERLEKIEAGSTPAAKVQANSELQAAVEPHAQALQNAAWDIHRDGLGGGADGATAYILGIGEDLRKQAAEGETPMIHRDHDWPLTASAARDVPLPAAMMASLESMIEPHASRLEEHADHLEKSGFGKAPHNGHAAHIRHVAHTMRAHAVRGKVAHFGHRFAASAAPTRPVAAPAIDAAAVESAVAKAVEAATKPLLEKISSQETKIADIKASAFNQADPPKRVTLPASIQNLLAKTGVGAPEEGKFMAEAEFDVMLKKAEIDPVRRIALKREAERAGVLSPIQVATR